MRIEKKVKIRENGSFLLKSGVGHFVYGARNGRNEIFVQASIHVVQIFILFFPNSFTPTNTRVKFGLIN